MVLGSVTCWNIWILPFDEASVLSPLKFFYVTDSFIHFFPEATIEIPLYLWKQVFWFKNFVLPVPPRLVNGKLGQGILIYVSKASVVARSIFIYPSSPKKKSVKSRWWTTLHYCTLIRKFQEELWNMRSKDKWG